MIDCSSSASFIDFACNLDLQIILLAFVLNAPSSIKYAKWIMSCQYCYSKNNFLQCEMQNTTVTTTLVVLCTDYGVRDAILAVMLRVISQNLEFKCEEIENWWPKFVMRFSAVLHIITLSFVSGGIVLKHSILLHHSSQLISSVLFIKTFFPSFGCVREEWCFKT